MSMIALLLILVAGIAVCFLIVGWRRSDEVATAIGVLLLVALAFAGLPAAVSDDPPPQRPAQVSTR
ncbi:MULTISPECIES: hypothetical protein [Mycobacteriaceae]|jgi:uncharacterized membrane protein (DUF4010 family)|uniref:Uncharacterized protein n=1 Tax=Mycolicibacterium senegalense TaxID=1796 RepID=A0ABR5FMG2_9MYCO|nr:hypothetical protein [Mycolicibacterium senegalense]KLI09282.1 hypothetical protein AA982_04290 [Mycolicibacterium senegalense]KLO47674.1 hypothetical protein ABW05_31310 [Mycolicibacterium senegalense]